LGLLLFSKTNLSAVKSGLSLWANSVIPSLFPFFIATELLMHTNIVNQLGFLFNKFMKPLFNIRGEGSFAFVMGIISGYPVGAKIATNFRQNNICTKEECERLLSFTNNSGPLFVIGTVGILMFKSTTIGILLFVTHLLSSISVGIVFRFWKKNKISNDYIKHSNINNSKYQNASINNLGEVISESIISAISTILLIGGFIVLFSSIISILKSSGIINSLAFFINPVFKLINIDTSFCMPLISGFIEITNGIASISSIACKKLSINIILTSFLLGFGGISVLLQVLSITSKTDLSIKPYILGKLLHGILASFYTYIFINIIPFFNFDI
jgi:sporulation integral membrane protein YlbJ